MSSSGDHDAIVIELEGENPEQGREVEIPGLSCQKREPDHFVYRHSMAADEGDL